jgi:hypothetical protein
MQNILIVLVLVFTGGNFWDGMRQGLITAGLNHAANHAAEGLTKRDDPPALLRDKNGKPYGVVIDGFFRRLTSTELSVITAIDDEYVAKYLGFGATVIENATSGMITAGSAGFLFTVWANAVPGGGQAVNGSVATVVAVGGFIFGGLHGAVRAYTANNVLKYVYIRELANNAVIPGLQNQNSFLPSKYSQYHQLDIGFLNIQNYLQTAFKSYIP